MSSTPIPAEAIEALYSTGHWLHSLGRHADAAVVFRAMAMASRTDERAWLALGACHEASGHTDIAVQLYGFGGVIAGPSVRCEIARSRALRGAGEDAKADEVLLRAEEIAEEEDDGALRALVAAERMASCPAR